MCKPSRFSIFKSRRRTRPFGFAPILLTGLVASVLLLTVGKTEEEAPVQTLRPPSGPAAGAIALNPDTWTPIGPAPLVNGTTSYREATSGRIAALAAHSMDPKILYIAAAGGGVWKTENATEDAGASWTPLTDFLTDFLPDAQATLSMGAIALAPRNPEVVYAGTGEATFGPSKMRLHRDNIYTGRGLLKSTNGGRDWELLGSTFFHRRSIAKIVVDPNDENTVYVAVGARATNGVSGNVGVWKSTNGGVNWRRHLPLATTDAVSDLIMDPNDPQTLYAAVGTPAGSTANGIYKSIDGGVSWDPAGNFPTGTSLGRMKLTIASDSQTLYVSVAASGRVAGTVAGELVDIYKTEDGGQSWNPLNMIERGQLDPPIDNRLCTSGGNRVPYLSKDGDYHSTLAVDPTDANIVYAGGLCLIRSTDGGSTWTNIANGQTTGPHHDHHAIGFDAQGRFLDGNDGGLWRLDNFNPVRWTNLNTNLQITQFNGLALHPSDANVAYGGAQDNGFVKFQGDGAWPRLERGDGGAVAVSADQPDTVYQIARGTVAFERDREFVRRSTDGGQTWTPILNGINVNDPKLFYPPLVMSSSNPLRLLLGTNHVYETTNGGAQWTARSPGQSGWTVSTRIDSVAIAPSLPRRLYAATAGRIFTTADRGVSWKEISLPVQGHVAMVVVRPNLSTTAYAVRDRFGGGHVWRTTDAGDTPWRDISGNLPDLPVYAITVDNRVSPPRLFIGTDNGVFVSTNTGVNWTRFQTGLPNVLVNSLQLNTTLNILAAGTHGRGVWEILVP